MKIYQEHAHAGVCSALTYSIFQCPGVMPSFTAEWWKGPFSRLRLLGPTMDYGLAMSTV